MLGATGVGDQRAWSHRAVDDVQRFQNSFDGLRQINDVGLRSGFGQRQRFIDGSAIQCRANGCRRTDPDDLPLKSGLAQRERERSADQAHAGDGDDAPFSAHFAAHYGFPCRRSRYTC